MIAPDSNLLIYAHQPSSPFHDSARRWFEEVISAGEPVGIPNLSVYGFLRFMTNTTIQSRPMSFTSAAMVVDRWLEFPNVQLLYPGQRHWGILRGFDGEVRIHGAHVTDAAIAAIAIEYGAVVHTNDRDFARYPGVRWFNPLNG